MIWHPTFISRIQFAFTISFHILFPSFSIGLATFLAIMEGAWLKTKKQVYYRICRFWSKVFALTFGMGVVSGIVMEFQLGTNWGGFTRVVGPVLGALFTYEVLTAFFIEAGFLGVMLFGWERISKGLHYFATLLVTFGVTLSAFWILSANSWMQTPSGAILKHGTFVVQSWWHVIFNPSVLPRYFHMLLASYLATAFVIAGISAFYLRHNLYRVFAKKCLSFILWVVLILIPVQIWLGDEAGLVDYHYQPAKTAAMEGNWQTQRGASWLILAWPDQAAQKNLFAIGIPHLASVINTHEWNGVVPGLKEFAPKDQPFVWIVFYSFRIMVALGMLMLIIGLFSVYLRYKKSLYDTRWFLRLLTWLSPIGFIALLTGWFTAESGRQPWVVYNILRTSQAGSVVSVNKVVFSLILLIVVYGIIFGVFYFRYLVRIVKKGPEANSSTEQTFPYMPINSKENKHD